MIYENVENFLENNTDDIICFCVGNGGCAKFVLNLVKSANLVGLPVVVFALDHVIAKALKGACDVVMYASDIEVDSSKFYSYGTKEFVNVIYQRFLIGDVLLKHGRTIVYTDVDVVVKGDFRKDILQLHKKFPHKDCLFQCNNLGKCCTGFYSIKPSRNTVGLFTQEFLDKNNYLSFSTNQEFLNQKVLSRELLNVKFLNRDEYPNGDYYYERSARIDPVCKIIHFNCIVGENEKINRMKEYGCWK